MLHSEAPQAVWYALFGFDLLPLLFDVPGRIVAHVHLPFTSWLAIAVKYLVLANGLFEPPVHLFEAAVLVCFQVIGNTDDVAEVVE